MFLKVEFSIKIPTNQRFETCDSTINAIFHSNAMLKQRKSPLLILDSVRWTSKNRTNEGNIVNTKGIFADYFVRYWKKFGFVDVLWKFYSS